MSRKVSLPIVQSFVPAAKWRWGRRLTQAFALVAVVVAPLLGGWQRLERNDMAAWEGPGWDLPAWLVALLPRGESPTLAHEANRLLGGGSGIEYFSVAVVDPVAGALALTTMQVSTKVLVAWLLPVGLALVAGRVFCGWLCPFGTLSRTMEGLLRALRWRIPRARVPTRRWLRWCVLALGASLGVAGFEVVLYLALPYVLVQQSAYGLWLLGGAGASLGWLVGLLVAGLFFGPSTYCATVCPTGAALSLLGRRRALRVTIAEPSSCGKSCRNCSRACWLSLDPASGDPGPDCDSCGRCFSVCPHTNLRIGWLRPVGRRAAAAAVALAVLVGLPVRSARAELARPQPRLVLDEVRAVRDVHVHIGIEDLTGVRLDADDERQLSGVRLRVMLVRGSRGAEDELGKLDWRGMYDGPIVIDVDGRVVELMEPNAPSSTPRRSFYRAHLPIQLTAGARIRIEKVPGWLDEPVSFRVPHRSPASWRRFVSALAVAVFTFGGALSLALALGDRPNVRLPNH